MIITQTPLRVSLLGGNTDYPDYFLEYGGAVLTTTIDKFVYCIVKERFDDEIWINYSIKEKVTSVADIKHDLVREAMKLVGVDKGIEITFMSDIPAEGSGLGSSSAVTVGVLNALHTYKGQSVMARKLAEEACTIEVDTLKKPIGYQDQYAVAFGGANQIEFGREINLKTVNVPEPSEFLLFYTGITRKAEDVLAGMTLDRTILDKSKALVYHAEFKPIYVLGSLLDEYWELKREMNPAVSTTEIDHLYAKALLLGARGGKIVGAGAGGFLLLVVPPDRQEVVRKGLNLRELPFSFSKTGSKVIFNITK